MPPLMNHVRLRAIALVLAAPFVLSGAACQCRGDQTVPLGPCEAVKGNQPDHPESCSSSAECGDHYACGSTGEGGPSCCLLQTSRDCNSEADCCPGQTCRDKRCRDIDLACASDAECGDQGDRFCETYSDPLKTTKRCRLRPCSPSGECPSGQSCFQGECVAGLPCDGSCEPGKACVPTTNRCQDYSAPTGRPGAACPVSCPAGHIATFKDNRAIWDFCPLREIQCVCAELPALSSLDLGRHSSLALVAGTGEVMVSHYDGKYGDLVVSRFAQDGSSLGREYIDGVPAGTAKYAPSGPRRGVVEPGDDVGRYTDVATAGGTVYVSYYDVTRGDLRLAQRTGQGPWSTVTVDGARGDLGLYSAIAIDADGLPAIAYHQRSGAADLDVSECPAPAPTGDKAFITALKLARATKPAPGPGDFTIRTLACESRPPPVCHACAQVCASVSDQTGCFPAASACAACTGSSDVCVDVGGAATCARKVQPSTVADLPLGTGLHPSLVFRGKTAELVFTRRGIMEGRPDGDLLGVSVDASLTPGPVVVLDALGDTGYFPSLAVSPAGDSLAIGYQSLTGRQLKFLLMPALASGLSPEVIDTGVVTPGAGEFAWVGADSAVVFGPSGVLLAVYQDATHGDLKLARRTNGWQPLPPIRTDGAVGFFADAALSGSRLLVSHARVGTRSIAQTPQLESRLILESVDLP